MSRRPKVTDAERHAARQQDLDRTALERLGIDAATRIGFRAQQAAMRAYRRGDRPGTAFRQTVRAFIPQITDAMVAGHLAGRRRTALTFQAAGKGDVLSLARTETAYSRALAVLKKRLTLPQDEIDALRKQYEAAAINVVDKATAAVEHKLEQALYEATKRGEHVKEGVKALGEAFEAAGMQPNNSFTLEAIFRTQTQLAYAAGRWQEMKHPAVDEILQSLKYVTVGDDRVRPEHAALDGVTLPKNDPFWNTNAPPNGWACRCTIIEIFDNRPAVEPPDSIQFNGRTVVPGPDKGFAFNPGAMFAAMGA